MFIESIVVIGAAGVVLAVAYFLDAYQAKLFRDARPSPVQRTRK